MILTPASQRGPIVKALMEGTRLPHSDCFSSGAGGEFAVHALTMGKGLAARRSVGTWSGGCPIPEES